MEEHKAAKESGRWPSGQMPVVIAGNMTLNQSNAIIRYFGKKHGLYGDTAEEQYYADWAIDTFGDLWKPEFYPQYFKESSDEA